jgi:C4-dicarboxylate transporter, DctQ subunit
MATRYIAQLSSTLQRVEEVLLASSILAIAGLTILNVGCRWLLGFSLAFTEEVSQFCVIIGSFVGLSYAASQGRHIRMTAIYSLWPRHVRKVFMIGITSTTAALMFALTWFATKYVSTVYELGGIYPVSHIPIYVVYLAAPLGFFLTGIQYSMATAKNLLEHDIYISCENQENYEEPVVQEI